MTDKEDDGQDPGTIAVQCRNARIRGQYGAGLLAGSQYT